MITRIWYMKPEFFQDFIMGPEFVRDVLKKDLPTKETIEQTHVPLLDVRESDPERIFGMMQAEVWSPRGEARSLIEEKGLRHTSMSVGDCMETGGKLLMVDQCGFFPLEEGR